MATTYKWNVNTMDVAPSSDGLSNVVKVIHWRLNAQNETHYVDTYSTLSLEAPDAANFTEFDALTEEQVIAWVESKLDVVTMKAGLDAQLEQLANPPIVTKSGPWNSTSPVVVPPTE